MMTSRRMSSSHWNHFIRLDFSKARCRYCQRVISMSRGSTGNLSRHMKLKHPAIASQGDAQEVKENGADSPVPIGEDFEVEIHEDDSGMKEHCEAEAPSESYCSTVILEPGDFKPSIPPLSSALLHRRRKQQRLSMDSTRRVQPKDEDEFAVMGRNIANKLRKLPLERVPVVEKLITDVIFEAQCGNVSQSSRITFYDMRSASLRHPNMRASPPPRQEGAGQKPEGQTLQGQTLQGQTLQGQTLQGQTLQVQTLQGQTLQGQTLPPNVVFLVPQAEGQKAIPLNVQMVPVPRPEGLNSKPSEQPVEPLVKQEDRSNGPE